LANQGFYQNGLHITLPNTFTRFGGREIQILSAILLSLQQTAAAKHTIQVQVKINLKFFKKFGKGMAAGRKKFLEFQNGD
jgi:hypothetical protein